ncbi:MAG TPA: DUF917 domain-containing protein [Solirubrobacteraceae bacterium]|nr:DUF917 domain-containing protein [Solirubrobacteraceae bacterium]
MSLRLDATNLPALARGCGVLAAGAEGAPELGLLMALVAVEQHGPVPVVALDDLPDDALVLPCGIVGAPALAAERVFGGDEGGALRDAAQDLHGADVGALMCLETAGTNGLLPVTWAARAGLPLVDAAGARRAFPGLSQRTMRVAGVPAAPVLLTDGRGNLIVIHAADDAWAERLARSAAAGLGGVCAGAAYAMSARRARSAAGAGAVSRALALGHALDPDGGGTDPGAVARALDGSLLIEGRVTDLDRTSATIDGTAGDAGRQLRLELQTAFLLALEDGAVRAAVPDLIAVLAADTGAPIAAQALRRGDRVAVLAAAADDVWRSGPGLAVAGPGAFGYAVEHAPA